MRVELVAETEKTKIVRLGTWIHYHDNETGEGLWVHDSVSENPRCVCGHAIGSHVNGTYACQVCNPCFCGRFELDTKKAGR